MKNIYIKSILLSSLFFAFSCNDDFKNDVDSINVDNGDADFTTYVALGNSLTSGYADGALYSSGQESSYPNIIATQMQKAGGGDFTQPMMPNDVGGFTDLYQATGGTSFYGKLTLEIVDGSLSPVPSTPEGTLTESIVTGSFNNMGVPGAKSYHLLADGYGSAQGIATGTANPYFVRFATSATTSVMTDAMAQSPSFFTLWIGNNDLLSYALSGGTGTDQNGNLDASTYGSDDLSDATMVGGAINAMLSTLTTSGAKGAIANLPDVSTIPYFTTVPSLPFTSESDAYVAQVDGLNAFYTSLNAVFDALGVSERKISFSATEDTGAVIIDTSLTDLSTSITQALVAGGADATQAALLGATFGQARQSTDADLFLLTTSSSLGQVDTDRYTSLLAAGLDSSSAGQMSVTGLTYPVQDADALTETEVTLLEERASTINTLIETMASNYGLALVDMNSKMKELQTGITFNGVTFTTTFVTGGAFSLDGIHLTPRGYAIVANEFMTQINNTYNSTLPMVDVNDYSGINIP